MTARQLAEWILKQPQDIQDGAVTGVVHGHLCSAKWAVAFRSGSDAGIYIEPMGTHFEHVVGFTYPANIDYCGKETFSGLPSVPPPLDDPSGT